MIFLLVVPIYLLLNFYIIKRILHWMGLCSHFFKKKFFKISFITVYILLATSMISAIVVPESPIKRLVKLTSNYWLGTLIYIIIFLCLADLLILIFKRTKWAHEDVFRRKRNVAVMGGIVTTLVIVISVGGMIHARVIKKTTYNVTINKTCSGHDNMKIALIADLHLGYNIGVKQIEKTVDLINDMNADLVVIAGDIFDNDYDALENPDHLIELFNSIKSKYGIYACYGNHDVSEQIIGGFTLGTRGKTSDERMDEFLKKANINLLMDESILIDNSFYIVGRRDAHKPGTDDNSRASIDSLTEKLDKTKPIFVIDHEPKELQEIADAGADIDFSGHTHDGQMFPGNLTIKLMWENPTGMIKKNDMYSIVTSGVGLWGPYMRVATDAEVVETNITFSK